MPTLHQLNAAHKLPTCHPLLAAGDRLLLLESAVTLVLDPALQALPAGVQLLVLATDLQARGLIQACPTSVQILDDEQWVQATLEADRVCSW